MYTKLYDKQMSNIPPNIANAQYIMLNKDECIKFASFALQTEPIEYENYIINYGTGVANKINELNGVYILQNNSNYSQIYVNGDEMCVFVDCGENNLNIIKFIIDYDNVVAIKQSELVLASNAEYCSKRIKFYDNNKLIVCFGYCQGVNGVNVGVNQQAYNFIENSTAYIVDLKFLTVINKRDGNVFVDLQESNKQHNNMYGGKYYIMVTNNLEMEMYNTANLGSNDCSPIYKCKLKQCNEQDEKINKYDFEINGHLVIVHNKTIVKYCNHSPIYKSEIKMHYFGQTDKD